MSWFKRLWRSWFPKYKNLPGQEYLDVFNASCYMGKNHYIKGKNDCSNICANMVKEFHKIDDNRRCRILVLSNLRAGEVGHAVVWVPKSGLYDPIYRRYKKTSKDYHDLIGKKAWGWYVDYPVAEKKFPKYMGEFEMRSEYVELYENELKRIKNERL